jgi:hypothetical protein
VLLDYVLQDHALCHRLLGFQRLFASCT